MLDRCSSRPVSTAAATYVTNAVKHFKWVPRGTRRIHSKPNSMEIAACFPWLEAEIAAVKPKVVVALGATAAQALFGKAFRVTRDRGRPVPSRWAPYAMATVHPSSLLRAPDEETRQPRDRPFHRGSEKSRGADARMTQCPTPSPDRLKLQTRCPDDRSNGGSRPAGSRIGLIGVIARRVPRPAGGRHRHRRVAALSGLGDAADERGRLGRDAARRRPHAGARLGLMASSSSATGAATTSAAITGR